VLICHAAGLGVASSIPVGQGSVVARSLACQLDLGDGIKMQSAIVVGLPWMRSGTSRVMQMQLSHLRDFGYRTVFAAVPTSYTGGFDEDSWRDFDRTSHELGADEIVRSGFQDLGPFGRLNEAAKAWKKGYNAMHWALAPAHFTEPAPRLATILADDDIRLILANHVYTMPFAVKLQRALKLRGRNVPLLVVTHDVQSHIVLDRKASAPWSLGMQAEDELVSTEIGWLAQADALIHLSHDDVIFFTQRLPEQRHHLMLPALPAMDLEPFRGKLSPKRELLYVGVEHFGNVQSLKWYFDKVVPLLGNAPPKLTLVGQICKAKEAFVPRELSTPWLELVDDADDLRPYYASSKAALGAATKGRGISIKTIEAFAAGLPVAGTELAFRGIPTVELLRLGIRSENESHRFADLVNSLLTGNERENAARASQEIYRKLFTPTRSAATFAGILKSFEL
jgi:polysaccharide biosynthesis protein PslH